MSKISIIIPCYNEQEMIPLLYPALDQAAQTLFDYNFEFLLIDDGSKDGTLQALRDLAKKDKRFKYISFSRNFGKEGAIYAGLQNASGDLCVIMDADLQDPPELLQEMVKAIEEEGYDSCATRRVRVNHPFVLSLLTSFIS